MWRHRARCNHCGQETRWQREREESLREIGAHLRGTHAREAPEEGRDYQVAAERQCDYCLEPYLDHCTKCDGDFCADHAGDIDGLCGGCI